MPETYSEFVNRTLRDHEGYTGDGKGGVGVLPVGDRSTARKPIDKKDLRTVLLAGETNVNAAVDAAARAEAAAELTETAMLDVQGASLFAADVPTLLANSAPSYPDGTVFATRAEGYSYEVASTSPHLTTAGGVGLRVRKRDKLSPLMFGAKRGPSNPGFNSSPAFAACLRAAYETGAKVIIDEELDLYGGQKIPWGVEIEWQSGAYTRQKKRSVTGGFLLCTGPDYDGGWVPLEDRQGIRLINPQIDGSGYPIHEGTVQAGSTATTIILDSGAPNIEGYFNGDIIEITTGTGVGMGWWMWVLNYDAATRTITVDTSKPNAYGYTALPSAPPAGASYRIGYNDPALLLGFGSHRTQILGGHIKNFPWTRDVAYGYGSKAINVERGHRDCLIDSVHIENCGAGIFLAGKAGAWAGDLEGPTQENSGIRMSGIHCLNVGAPLVVIGTTSGTGPTGNPALLWAQASDWTCRNVGHNPHRLLEPGAAKEKSAPIILGGAENLKISNWSIFNEPGYPAAYPIEPAAAGYGLSGPIGAVLQGWGRNILVSGMDYYGNCDQLVHIKRPRSLNVDAGNTNILHSERFDIDGLRHFGTAKFVAETESDAAYKISRTYLTGTWKITPDVLSDGVIGPALGGNDHNGFPYDYLHLELRKYGSQALVAGTPERLRTLGGNSLDTGRTTSEWHKGRSVQYDRIRTQWLNGQTYVTPNAAATAITLPCKSGIVALSSQTSGLRMMFGFRCEDHLGNQSPQVDPILVPTATTLQTGAWAAGQGADASFNVAISGAGSLTVSNRRGTSVTWNAVILAGT